MNYNGYTAAIYFSTEDGCLVGQIIGINDIIGFHGDSVKEVRKAFHESVDDYLATCAKSGHEPNKPFSGCLDVQISPELHQQCARKAAQEALALNEWVVKVLSDAVHHHP